MPKRTRLTFLLTVAFVLLLAAFTVFIHTACVPPILMYHSITSGLPKSTLEVRAKTFERQMDFLKKNHYNVLPLDSLARMIKNKEKIPAHTVALTFDDGRRDNYTLAFPILKKYNLPATIFIIINDTGNPDRLSWEEMATLQDSGLITLGSHTMSHPYLPDIKSDEELRNQIFNSRKILEEKIKRPVYTFSYPIGGFNSRVRQMVQDAGYKCAVATHPGRNYPSDDVFALKRVKITDKAGNMFIFWFQASGYYSTLKDFFSTKNRKYGE